jgi:hypothetical protein
MDLVRLSGGLLVNRNTAHHLCSRNAYLNLCSIPSFYCFAKLPYHRTAPPSGLVPARLQHIIRFWSISLFRCFSCHSSSCSTYYYLLSSAPLAEASLVSLKMIIIIIIFNIYIAPFNKT